ASFGAGGWAAGVASIRPAMGRERSAARAPRRHRAEGARSRRGDAGADRLAAMHLLTTSSTGLDDLVEAVDLGQPPGDIAVLSFADSDLSGLAAAWDSERAVLPSVRLAHLRDLRHPMSVDVGVERVGGHAEVLVVRLLGGLD